MAGELRIDVWSDYVCPFCYLELPLLQRLQQEMGPQLQVHWRAFELRPDPVPTLDPDGEYLHDIWGRAVYPMAAQRGMNLRLPPVQPRSRKAFEAVAHARSQGYFERMHLALFRAFFEEGRDIGRIDVLVDIGASVGMDAAQLQQALDDGRHLLSVVEDEELALNLGITGVPLMLIRPLDRPLHEGLGISGAAPYERMLAAVSAARAQWSSP